MKITLESILIGADDTELWLFNFNHKNIKFKRQLYSEKELKEKYSYFKYDSRYSFWFDEEKYHNICYELIYNEEMESTTDEILYNRIEEIFKYCQKLVCLINAYFGTPLIIKFGNFYIDGEFYIDYRDALLLDYNPSILEDFSKLECSKEDLEIFCNILEKLDIQDSTLETIIETYNMNMSISNVKISFINLTTCLEMLLITGKGELSYKLSRGVAVTISKNKQEGKDLFNKMKELYEIRSNFIHNGCWKVDKYYKKYKSEPFEDLKEIFILVFRKYINLGLSKDNFIQLINESGYGNFL